jgi:S-adenosylmethionine hydrolase
MAARTITFLSDYGHDDEFVGVCHGVIRRVVPYAVVIDITHGIPPQDVRRGAIVLRSAVGFMPPGVHLAVVDPGVGTDRRALAIRCSGEQVLVGPDNGLLWPAAARLGRIEEAVDISDSPFRLQPMSATFQGRDLFAPVAAHLARGASLREAGDSIPPEDVARLDLPLARAGDGEVSTVVLYADRFGNVQLGAERAQMEKAGLKPGQAMMIESNGERHSARYGRAFAEAPAGHLLVYEDSSGAIAIAVNRGDAAASLQLEADDEVRLLRTEP